jgi:hypothetical protein
VLTVLCLRRVALGGRPLHVGVLLTGGPPVVGLPSQHTPIRHPHARTPPSVVFIVRLRLVAKCMPRPCLSILLYSLHIGIVAASYSVVHNYPRKKT